jgi:pimeloyl-ACP methyl ester carboxylesterase
MQVLRIAVVTVGVLLGLGVLTSLFGVWESARLARSFPAPGRLVDVGGHRLHLNCAGHGSPAVILEAGLGDFSVYWQRVQPAVARFTRVCSYDRAGYAWSEAGPLPRTSEQITDELHALVAAASIESPFVLVGHSLGGLNARFYAHRFPEQVDGMVLVDAVHEEQDVRLSAYSPALRSLMTLFERLVWVRRLGMVAIAPRMIPDRGLPSSALAEYRATLIATDYFGNALAEMRGIKESLSQVRAARIVALGTLPTVVISRGRADPLPGRSAEEIQHDEAVWRALQADLASLSSNSRHVVASNSSHDVHLQQPQIVIDAIRQVVEAARAGKPLDPALSESP